MKPKNTERKKNQIKFVSIVSLPHLQLHTVSSKQKTKTHISCKTVPFVFKWPRINSHKTTHTHTHRHTSVFHFAACEAHFAPFSPYPTKWRYKCTQKNDSTLFCVCRESERARQLGCLLFGWQSFLGVIKRNEKQEKINRATRKLFAH